VQLPGGALTVKQFGYLIDNTVVLNDIVTFKPSSFPADEIQMRKIVCVAPRSARLPPQPVNLASKSIRPPDYKSGAPRRRK